MRGRRIISESIVGLVLAAVAMQLAPAGAHPGHEPTIITIERPAAGKIYDNDTEIGGIGGAATHAVTLGPLTVTVKWECKAPPSTYAHVLITTLDPNNVIATIGDNPGAKVSGTWSAKPWKPPAAGTYTLRARVRCMHWAQDDRGNLKAVQDSEDVDFRNVVAVV